LPVAAPLVIVVGAVHRAAASGAFIEARFTVPAEETSGVRPRVRTDGQVYGTTARVLHWSMAVLVLLQIAAGLVMVHAGPEPGLLARLSSALDLYSVHKLLGVVLLALVLVRIAWRIARGAPPEEPGLAVWQRWASTLVHTCIYLALILVPILGWVATSLYPALAVFGRFSLPALTAPDEARSAAVFAAHALAAYALAALVIMHVGAALYHHFVRGDGVLVRMLPGLRKRGTRSLGAD
jgi:cytochrome b561